MEFIPCIKKLRPDVAWKDNMVNGFDLTMIAKTYQSKDPLPTLAECEAVWPEIEAEHAAIKQTRLEIKAEKKKSVFVGKNLSQAKKIVKDKFDAVKAESTNTAKIDSLIDACEDMIDKLVIEVIK